MYELNKHSYTLKVSKYCVNALRTSELFLDDIKRSRAVLILDLLTDYINGKMIYPVKDKLMKYIRENICSNDTKLKQIIIDLETAGMILFKNDRLTKYKRPLWQLQITKEYQNNLWYTFAEEMPEFNTINKIKTRMIKNQQAIWNDDKLTLDEKYLTYLQEEHSNNYFIEFMRQRNDGNFIQSETKKSQVGRFYGIYSNIKREYRKYIKDANTGNYLMEIDNKASQISFLLSYLEIVNAKTNSDRFRLELDELKEIQREDSFHDYFAKAINTKTPIDRNTIKPLIFKFVFGNITNHNSKHFNKEIQEEFKQKNYDIELVWEYLVSIFRTQFPETYRILQIEYNKLKYFKTTIAANVQKNESSWLKDIISQLKKLAKKHPEFQYYTLHDSISFSREFFPEVLSIVKDVNEKWFLKCGVELNYKISGTQEITKAHIEDNTHREIALICALGTSLDNRIKTWTKGNKEYWRIKDKQHGDKCALKSKYTREQFLEIVKEWLSK